MSVRNAEPFLTDCLDSILRQSYHNWELIVIDDHSNDDSRTIVSTYERSDERIQLFTNRGEGIISALRMAWSLARGIYVTRMDADDIMADQKLECMHQALQTAGRGHVAIGQVEYFHHDDQLGAGYLSYQNWLNDLTSRGANFTEIYKECVIPSPCWMLHRKDFQNIQSFDSDRYPEDYDLAFRMYRQRLQVIPCKTVLHHWRDYSTRSSRTDPRYADNRFLHIKCHYFLQCDWQSERPLCIWGAGKKGKEIVRIMKSSIGGHIQWISDNTRKVGQNIYGLHIRTSIHITTLDHPQIIVAVAGPRDQHIIRQRLEEWGKKPLTDYFFFC